MPLRAHAALACLLFTAFATHPQWRVEFPILNPGPAGAFDSTAVKDPSIVFADKEWRIFYTARGDGHYSLGYTHAPHLQDLMRAPHTPLPALSHGLPTIAAPQVFYFRPRKLWFLLYQTSESNYQPVYSTTADIADPNSWTAPQPLVTKAEPAKWIDFWIICDQQQAFLFYTRDHHDVVAMTTPLADFPHNFAHPKVVFTGVHEAVHIYRETASSNYAMLYELRSPQGQRNFGLAQAPNLAGPWRRITDTWASAAQLALKPRTVTTDVSHGELLRTGTDETLEADLAHPRFLIQGWNREPHGMPLDYPELPWRLLLIRRN